MLNICFIGNISIEFIRRDYDILRKHYKTNKREQYRINIYNLFLKHCLLHSLLHNLKNKTMQLNYSESHVYWIEPY